MASRLYCICYCCCLQLWWHFWNKVYAEIH